MGGNLPPWNRLLGVLLQRIGRTLERGASRANALSKRFAASESDKPHRTADVLAQWFHDRGDKTLRLYYDDLCEDSLVLDLGGYEGQWASDIYSIYRCRIHVFEPVVQYAERIERRFQRNPDIRVHAYGLAECDCTTTMGLDDNSSSIFKPGRGSVVARMVRANDFFQRQGIQFVDLMKINIEGAEYSLLEHLLTTRWTKRIRNLQVQFHSFVPDAVNRMHEIQQRISETHELTYRYEFVWENWRLRDQPD